MTRRTLFLLGVSGASGCRRDTRPRLNVFNWSSYIAPNTIENFEREFNVRVRYAVYESNEELFARVMSGNSGWDVVFPTSYVIEPMCAFELLAPLEHARLTNLNALDIAFRNPAWDPGLRWGVPYMWTGTGIAYRRREGQQITSWSDMWQPALQGRITMLDDPVDVFAACLKKFGLSVNTRDPGELRRAQAEAIEQKEYLRAYINAEVRDQLVAGDVLASQMWSTTAQQAIDESKELAFVYPSEGYPIGADVAVVLRESRRRELAHLFLDYLLRPDVAAAIVLAARTSTANGRARALLPHELQTNPTLYPLQEVLDRGEWLEASPPEIQKLRDRLWTEIKAS